LKDGNPARPNHTDFMACDDNIELTIRDLKQHFGLGDYQCTTPLAILRFVHLTCLAFCLWWLALSENLKAGWLQVVLAREPLPEAPRASSEFVGPCGLGPRGR
jgi:hypothetical protein